MDEYVSPDAQAFLQKHQKKREAEDKEKAAAEGKAQKDAAAAVELLRSGVAAKRDGTRSGKRKPCTVRLSADDKTLSLESDGGGLVAKLKNEAD